jgi:hypothetical protein
LIRFEIFDCRSNVFDSLYEVLTQGTMLVIRSEIFDSKYVFSCSLRFMTPDVMFFDSFCESFDCSYFVLDSLCEVFDSRY